MINNDWGLLMQFFPNNWKELALQTNSLKGLRKDKSEENLLRTLMIHLGCGYSLRETATRAKRSELANLSDVALLKRLKKSKDWLFHLCKSLFNERGIHSKSENEFKIRLFDATHVKEPGKTGSLWRIHYSMELPTLCCDFLKLTPSKGEGNGESFKQFNIKKNDHIIADRGYSTASGIHYITNNKAYVSVRVNTQSLRILNLNKQKFQLLRKVKNIKTTRGIKSWNVLIPENENHVEGRLCVIRKSEEAIKIAHKKIKRVASKHGNKVKPDTFIYAQYIIVFSTFSEKDFSPFDILEWYRIRWQIELVFKRFKQIVQLGHLPKYDDESAKAWLYGKLFIALLTEKVIDYANSFSPWGYFLEKSSLSKPMA